MGDALDVVKREVHVGGLRHGEDMQHCIGGATHGHIHGHGVLERFLGGDGTREHSLVIIVVILLGDLDDLLGGALEQILAVGVRSQNGAIAWQGQADASVKQFIEFAVNMPAQEPQVGQTVFS